MIHEYKLSQINDLIPYINNSRTHSDEQVTQIAASIKEFGFTNPVLIDKQGGLIAGHGRVMAAKKLGLTEAPSIVLAGLTEAQKKAYIIADNQLPLNAGWDYEMLKLELENLQELDFNIDLLGFDELQLGHIIDGWDSDIEIPMLDDDGEMLFKVKVSGQEVDKDDVMSTLQRAIKESGIKGIKIE